MTSQINIWKKVYETGFGVNSDVSMDWAAYVLFDDSKEDACEVTIVDYPGWDYGYTTFPSQKTCSDYKTHDYLATDYDSMWYRSQ